jgi:pyrimidine operon attenuation protein/uracil phosphoribosyltransferase
MVNRVSLTINNKGEVMAKQKAQQIQKLRIDKKAKITILNYGLIKDNIKSLSKQASLIKEEILPYFQKQNAIVLVGMDNGYEGYAQRINRQSKRFDMAKFKETNPKLYAQYLIDSESTEIKVSFKVVDAKK